MNLSSTSSTSYTRITGMASGLDTESIIKGLMKTERVPLDKLMQKRQLSEWKTDAYRSNTNLLRGLKDDYFNVSKSASNMLSLSSYKKFTTVSSDSTVVTAVGSADASAGSHTIVVNNIATAVTYKSSNGVTKPIQASGVANFTLAQSKSFTMTLDGTQKTITVGTDTGVLATNITNLQTAINTAFGAGKVAVVDAGGGKLNFSSQAGSGVNKIVLSAGSADTLLNLGFQTGDNLSNRLNMGDTLATISSKTIAGFTFDASNQLNMTINGKNFKFDKTITLSSMINQISSDPTANVTMQYDDISDTFSFTAKQSGIGSNIQLSETGSTFLAAAGFKGVTGTQSMAPVTTMNFSGVNSKSFSVVIDGVAKDITLNTDYSANPDYTNLMADIKSKIEVAFTGKTVSVSQTAGKLSINLATGGNTLSIGAPALGTSALASLGLTANYTAGSDAKVVLDGQSLTRSNNTFTVSGVSYTLLKQSSTPQTITLSQNTDAIYDNIKKFVDKYNEVISTINGKLSEKYDRNYPPLTDDQKLGMSADDIKKWEDKAKTGLLRSDPLLQGIVIDMRKALYDVVKDVTGGLSSIGITTGSYDSKGKLVINETKLKAAIQSNPDNIMNLFAKQSSISNTTTLTAAQKTQRYNEEGLAVRLSDIIEKNISTYGEKGLLLKKAGIENDRTEFSNILFNEIKSYNTQILNLNSKLTQKESAYYQKFARMEAALKKMNAQSNWLSSKLGGG